MLHNVPRHSQAGRARQGPCSALLQIRSVPLRALPDSRQTLHSGSLLLFFWSRHVLPTTHLPRRPHLAHDRFAFHFFRRQGVLAKGRIPELVFLPLHGRQRAVKHLHS